MNIRQAAKRRTRHQPRYHLVYEPDYDSEAWHGSVPPTPKSHPEAFYAHLELVNPPPAKENTRKRPHEALSTGALKKRVRRAGLRGRRAAEVAREIRLGPGIAGLTPGGVTVMGWPLEALRSRYGHRVARAVTRFVRAKVIMLDEAWNLLGSEEMSAFVLRGLQSMRKSNFKAVQVSQSLPALAAQS